LIKELHNLICGHLSDEELTLLANGDLPAPKQARVDQHVAACGMCRARLGCFKDMFLQVAAYHASRAQSDKLHDRERRARLAVRLNQMPDHVDEWEIVRPVQAKRSVGARIPMNPILATGLLLAFASLTCIFVWMQQTRPVITSNALLVHAEGWDPIAGRYAEPGIIRQIVKITTREQNLKRTIYRDAQGKRKPRQVQMAAEEDELKRKLAEAGVDWDAPLSATDYQVWHDKQRVREDKIKQSAGHLLVLTTTTPNGAVTGQSLTVRDTDFHPVSRAVSFRNSETVEIAELDYTVLPWSLADNNLFQPEEGLRSDGLNGLHPTLVPLPPAPITEVQRAEAELSARLVLNRLHADTGEQIEVVRATGGVEIRGITDTEARKHELEAQLDKLSHVTASISSIEEMRARPARSGDISSMKVIAMQTQETPLETYYLAHGRSVAALGSLSRRLSNTVFAINLESRAIDDLEHRFPKQKGISLIASATLSDLLFTHKHKLLAALHDEEQLLTETQILGAVSRANAPLQDLSNLPLTGLAERNLALSRELALGKGPVGQSAELIVSELAVLIDELSHRAHEIRFFSQDSTNLDIRK
jgi:hypothetical protein